MDMEDRLHSGKIYVIGIGPGDGLMMTGQAIEALRSCDVVAGYKVYIDLIRDVIAGKEVIESGMRQEIDRCENCLKLAKDGKIVALVCSGDAGVYGMASPMLEIAEREGFSDVEIIPGVTAALSGAAMLGAPIGHDFCVISLSDLLTPWDLIKKRIRLACEADLCIVLYNPASRNRSEYLKRACEVMLTILPAARPCGYAKNIGRSMSKTGVCTLSELGDIDADMTTTVFVGNSRTYISGCRLITPRGYTIK